MSATPSIPPPGGTPSSRRTSPIGGTSRRPVVGIALGVAGLVLALAAWGHSSAAPADGDVSLRPTGHVDHVELSVESGTVEIVAGDEILVEAARSTRAGSDVTLDHDLSGGHLGVRVSCSRVGLRWGCETPVRLVVPPGTPVTAAIQAGTITASALTAGADLRTDAGTIDVRDLAGTIRLRSATGSISGTVRSGSLDAATSAGAITISVVDDLTRLSVATEVGPIDLVVPEDDYRIDARTTLGRTDVAFGSTTGSTRTIEARSEIGNVTIRSGTSNDDG